VVQGEVLAMGDQDASLFATSQIQKALCSAMMNYNLILLQQKQPSLHQEGVQRLQPRRKTNWFGVPGASMSQPGTKLRQKQALLDLP
jgi:hypothetical protein